MNLELLSRNQGAKITFSGKTLRIRGLHVVQQAIAKGLARGLSFYFSFHTIQIIFYEHFEPWKMYNFVVEFCFMRSGWDFA